MGWASPGHFSLIQEGDSGNRIYIKKNGNVGLGTSNPRNTLELGSGGIRLSDPAAATNTNLVYNAEVNGSGMPTGEGFRMRYENDLYGTSLDALVFDKTDVNANDPDGGIAFVNTGQDGQRETAMVIRGNGNIGVGGTDPTANFQVGGTPNNFGLVTTLGVSQEPGDTVALSLRRTGLDPIMQFCGDGNGGCSYVAFNRTTGAIGIGAAGYGTNPALSVGLTGGNVAVNGDVSVTGRYRDSSNNAGANGQVLSSTGTETVWVSAAGGSAPAVEDWQIVNIVNTAWSNNGGEYNDAGYFKDNSGVVHLRGMVIAVCASNSTIFTLPEGYRPPGRSAYAVAIGPDTGRLDVHTNGDVKPLDNVSGTLSLEGITFRVAP